MPVLQAIRMATLGGARALKLDKVCGSLEVGKAADMQVVYMGGIESAPMYDVLSHLAYCTGRTQVRGTWFTRAWPLSPKRAAGRMAASCGTREHPHSRRPRQC